MSLRPLLGRFDLAEQPRLGVSPPAAREIHINILLSPRDNRPVFGVWMVDHEAAGLGIREDTRRITGNLSRFVPHFFPAMDVG